jgi:hypothetical protein
MKTQPTPLGALVRGLLAGAGGTAVMTAYQQLVRSGGGSGDSAPETEEERWQRAPAPAQVARRVLKGLFQSDVSAERIPLLANLMHWLYGTTLGAVYGLVQGTLRARPVAGGLAFGGGVWLLSYAELVPMGLYEPPWEYPPKELVKDLSYHLVYGLGVAATYERVEVLSRR